MLGLLAEREGRLREARGEFEQALAPVRGFTRTNVELARVDVALGLPSTAIDVLRRAYHEPVDAMGRYATRSEMNYQMSLAFAKANQPDSARTYASYVRGAWVHADPEFAHRLAALPRTVVLPPQLCGTAPQVFISIGACGPQQTSTRYVCVHWERRAECMSTR